MNDLKFDIHNRLGRFDPSVKNRVVEVKSEKAEVRPTKTRELGVLERQYQLAHDQMAWVLDGMKARKGTKEAQASTMTSQEMCAVIRRKEVPFFSGETFQRLCDKIEGKGTKAPSIPTSQTRSYANTLSNEEIVKAGNAVSRRVPDIRP